MHLGGVQRYGMCGHERGSEVMGVARRGTAKRHVQLGGAQWHGPCGWEGCGDGVHVAGRGVATWCVQLRGAWRAGAATLEKHKHNKSQLVKARKLLTRH